MVDWGCSPPPEPQDGLRIRDDRGITDYLQATAMFEAIPLSRLLLGRQLTFYGHIAALPDTNPVRQVTLVTGSCKPNDWQIKRRVGRPKLRWTNCVYALALDVVNGREDVLNCLVLNAGQSAWAQAIRVYITSRCTV